MEMCIITDFSRNEGGTEMEWMEITHVSGILKYCQIHIAK